MFKISASIIDSWPMMGSPAPLVITCGIYLSFVLKIGPRYMSDRKPFNLDNFVRCYNVFQIIACTYFVNWAYKRGFSLKSIWSCAADRTDDEELLDLWKINWTFIALRLIEFTETVVFVLRKKQNQVSTLHVYHHISTVSILWIFFKYGRNEMGIYSCTLNCMVHIVMYSYYLLTSFKGLRDHLKVVKPLITILQLTQLVAIFGNTVAALLPSCNQTKIYYLMIINMLILIGFFTKFYIETYTKTSDTKRKEKIK